MLNRTAGRARATARGGGRPDPIAKAHREGRSDSGGYLGESDRRLVSLSAARR